MKIVVAKTAGFCMGVRRAVDMVLDASNLSDKKPLYTYGSLIHNPQVLEMLEEKKIFRLDSIPEKGKGIVLIRAHGVPPEDEQALKNAGFTIINATCPRVIKVQVIIQKYAKKGYSTIIVGDKNHPEVTGLLGYANKKGHTITNMDQLEKLPKFDNAVIVAQTTQDSLFYDQIKKWCKIHAPAYKIFDTICGSTERRQAEIRKLANENDAVIVVGGKQSGNTKRLAQIAYKAGKPTLHIEDVSEVDYNKLSLSKSIAVTAGASTPNWIINDTCTKLANSLQTQHPGLIFLLKIRNFLLHTNIMAATGAGFLTYACSVLQGFDKYLSHALTAMLYVLSMQILNNLFMIQSDKYNNPQKAFFYKNNKLVLWIGAVLSGATGLYLSFTAGIPSFLILLVMSILGLSYNLRFMHLTVRKKQLNKIKDIPGSKTILITIAWSIVTCLLPALVNKNHFIQVIPAFLFATCLVFARTAFFDILAIQGDKITGKETLPVILGEKQSFNIIQYILVFDIFIILLADFKNIFVNQAFIFAFVPFLMFLLIRFFKNDTNISNTNKEFIIETSLIWAGLVSFII